MICSIVFGIAFDILNAEQVIQWGTEDGPTAGHIGKKFTIVGGIVEL